MIKTIVHFLFYLFLVSGPAFAQTASILPQPKTQYLDDNGNPLSSGKVYNYIVNTFTFKNTWQDSTESTLNTNPVTLDAGGRGLIYGQGTYRQIIKKANGDTVVDGVTSSTGSGGGSASTGDGDLVGTVKPWAGISAPNQYAFAYGQEISRTTYSVLLTAITLTANVICTSANNTLTGISDTGTINIGSPVEGVCIPSGTTVVSKTSSTVLMSNPATITVNTTAQFFPFGAGNGSTTFNVPDLRGYVVAGRDNMGGTAAARLTTTYFGANSPDAQGATGGAQSNTIAQANLPVVTLSTAIASGQGSHTHTATTTAVIAGGTSGGAGGSGFFTGVAGAVTVAAATLPAMTGTTPLGGSGTAISRIQPTMTLSYIIKITPDTNSSVATGVTDIQGMTGSIACVGAGITCTGNNITVNATGDVTGPSSSTNNNVALFSGTSGKIIKDGGAIRLALTGATSYYIRTDGNDTTCNGTADASSASAPNCAFLTEQKVVNTVQTLDFNGNAVRIKFGEEGSAKTFTRGLVTINTLTGGGSLTFSPSSSGTNIVGTNGAYELFGTITPVYFGALHISSTGNYGSLIVANQSILSFDTIGPTFSGSTNAHVFCHDNQAQALILGSTYSVTGGASYWLATEDGCTILHEANAVTFVGTPVFNTGVLAIQGGIIQSTADAYTGSISGQRYFARDASVISGGGAGNQTYFPGSAAGQHSLNSTYVGETALQGIVIANGPVSPTAVTTSVGIFNAISDPTGTAGKLVFDTNPTFPSTVVIGTDVRNSVAVQLGIGSTSGDSIIEVGQSTTRGGVFAWGYNATPSIANLSIMTLGYSNPIAINGSLVAINQSSLGDTYLFGTLHFGTTANGIPQVTSGTVSYLGVTGTAGSVVLSIAPSLTGSTTMTNSGARTLSLLSGNATTLTYLGVGTNTPDTGVFGVVGAANNYFSGTSQNDIVLYNGSGANLWAGVTSGGSTFNGMVVTPSLFIVTSRTGLALPTLTTTQLLSEAAVMQVDTLGGWYLTAGTPDSSISPFDCNHPHTIPGQPGSGVPSGPGTVFNICSTITNSSGAVGFNAFSSTIYSKTPGTSGHYAGIFSSYVYGTSVGASALAAVSYNSLAGAFVHAMDIQIATSARATGSGEIGGLSINTAQSVSNVDNIFYLEFKGCTVILCGGPTGVGAIWGVRINNASTFTASGSVLGANTTINYGTQTGNYTIGLKVTGATSKATAIIVDDRDNGATGILYLANIQGTFQSGEIIADTSTGSATTTTTLNSAYTAGQGIDLTGATFANCAFCSTGFNISATGRLLLGITTANATYAVGTITPQSQIHGLSTSTSSFAQTTWVASTVGPGLFLSKSRGAVVGTRGIVSSGDVLGALRFEGDDGTNFVPGALIRAEVDGTPGANDMPGRLIFATTLDGANAVTSRMTIFNDGSIGFGAGTTALGAGVIAPTTNDGYALGTATLSFSDLFLASGGVINWNNSAVALTQSAGVLTLSSSGVGMNFTVNSGAGSKASAIQLISSTTSWVLGSDFFSSGATTLEFFDFYTGRVLLLSGGAFATGQLSLSYTTDATNTTNGSLALAGGLSVVKSAVLGGSIIVGASGVGTATIGTTTNLAPLTVSANTSGLPAAISGTVAHFVAPDSGTATIALQAFNAGNSLLGRRAGGTAAIPSAMAGTTGAPVGMLTLSGQGYYTSGGTAYSTTTGQIQIAAIETFTSSAWGTAILFYTTPKTTAVIAEAMRIQDSGGVSVGTTTDPGIGSLQINSKIFAPNLATTTAALGAALCWTATTGEFQRDTNAGGCLVSIGAAKNLIRLLNKNDALNTVMRLEPSSFRYKPGYGDNGQYEQVGFVAEQVASVDERLAARGSEGMLTGVKYMQMTATLAAAIQQLKGDNDNLKADNDNLKEEIKSIKRAIGMR